VCYKFVECFCIINSEYRNSYRFQDRKEAYKLPAGGFKFDDTIYSTYYYFDPLKTNDLLPRNRNILMTDKFELGLMIKTNESGDGFLNQDYYQRIQMEL